MKKMLFGAVLFLTGCTYADAIEQHPTNNPQVDVELLFSHDGCDVFRFRDIVYHYYVRCNGPTAQRVQTNQTVSCGKSCRRDEAIQTITSPAH